MRKIAYGCFSACALMLACTKCALLQRAGPALDVCGEDALASLTGNIQPIVAAALGNDGLASSATQTSLEGLGISVGIPAVVCAVQAFIGAAHGPAMPSGTTSTGAVSAPPSPRAQAEAHKFLNRHGR